MKEFICRFSDDIHDKLREEAYLRKKSMADIVREAMHDYCCNKAQNPLSANTKPFTVKKKPLIHPVLKLSESCLQKIWDNDSDDIYNDL